MTVCFFCIDMDVDKRNEHVDNLNLQFRLLRHHKSVSEAYFEIINTRPYAMLHGVNYDNGSLSINANLRTSTPKHSSDPVVSDADDPENTNDVFHEEDDFEDDLSCSILSRPSRLSLSAKKKKKQSTSLPTSKSSSAADESNSKKSSSPSVATSLAKTTKKTTKESTGSLVATSAKSTRNHDNFEPTSTEVAFNKNCDQLRFYEEKLASAVINTYFTITGDLFLSFLVYALYNHGAISSFFS